MGRADLIGNEDYATDELRKERGPEIEKIISSWTRTKTKFEILKEVTDLGIPCGAVQDTLEVLHDPHLRAREMVVSLEDPVRGEHLAMGCPIKIRSNKVEIKPPPLLGQHSKELLAELLKMEENDLAELEIKGVI
jgi:formyl-CoA transferase